MIPITRIQSSFKHVVGWIFSHNFMECDWLAVIYSHLETRVDDRIQKHKNFEIDKKRLEIKIKNMLKKEYYCMGVY